MSTVLPLGSVDSSSAANVASTSYFIVDTRDTATNWPVFAISSGAYDPAAYAYVIEKMEALQEPARPKIEDDSVALYDDPGMEGDLP